jgi:glycine betaine/proline transport system ATP-binding protein
MPQSEHDTRPVRLSCRHVWKLFGEDPGSFFDKGADAAGDVEARIAKVVEADHIPAVCDVGFDVREGEIFVIMGLSGSGKSTIVRCLSRLVEPTAGEIEIDGEDILALGEKALTELRRHKMGMVFQNFGLLPHLNVLDNVAYPLRVQGIKRDARENRAREMIELVGLKGREFAFPRELSGGMQQRVGIARSLAVEPDIWFLDEPFSALDPLIRRQMQDEFMRLQNMLHKTIVFITHDFLEALRLADRIAIMRDGRIVQIGTPANLVLHPADDYVAEFTRDVPRAKVVTARTIGTPADEPLSHVDGAVSADTTLDELLPRLIGRREPLPVVGGDGRMVAKITVDDVLKALARAENDDDQ